MKYLLSILLCSVSVSSIGQEVFVLGKSDKVKFHPDDETEGIDSLIYVHLTEGSRFCGEAEVYYDEGKKSLAYKSFAKSDTCHKYDYWRNGQLKKHVKHIKHESMGIPIWWWYEAYCSNGQLIYRGPSPNQLHRFTSTTYYCNGEKFREFVREGEGAVGEIKFWYSDGQLKEVWNFEDHRAEGEWKYFDETGNLFKVEVYRADTLIETKNY